MQKFLLVDDHVVVRSGIKPLLSQQYPALEIYEAFDGASAVEQLKARDYELIILDNQMPGTDTIKLMEFIHLKYPLARVLIFSMSAEGIYAKRFLKAGAKGFVPKEAPLEEIIKAINQVLLNKRYIFNGISSTKNIQVSTVGTHKARMFKKLGVSNLLELKELYNSDHK